MEGGAEMGSGVGEARGGGKGQGRGGGGGGVVYKGRQEGAGRRGKGAKGEAQWRYTIKWGSTGDKMCDGWSTPFPSLPEPAL